MISMGAKVEGLDRVNRILADAAKKIEDPKPMLDRVQAMIFARIQKTMDAGKNADGQKLARVAPWTRVASEGKKPATRPVPLNRTGTLKRSMAMWSTGKLDRYVGWKGSANLKIVDRMTHGKAGRMEVAEKGVRGWYSGIKEAKDGRNYIRIKTPVGWRTKRVVNRKIAIKPKARKFFYISDKMVKRSGEIADKYIKDAIR